MRLRSCCASVEHLITLPFISRPTTQLGIGRAARAARTRRHAGLGAIAGTVGTLGMDLALYMRYRREGGTESAWNWESARSVENWGDASAPGQIGRKVAAVILRREPPDRWARATTNAVHLMTGIGWGLQYGALAAKSTKHPLARVLALGPAVWMAGYVVLPLAGVYEPIWKYDAKTLGKDLSAHLVYGLVTGATFASLSGGGGRRNLSRP